MTSGTYLGRLAVGGLAAAAMLAASVPNALAQDVTLRMATWVGSGHHLAADTLPVWFKAVEDASGGTLHIKLDPAPIASPPEQYDIVRKGAADLAYHVMGYTPGPFEIVRAAELPFLSPNAEIGSQATWDWYDRNVGFDKEFSDIKVITLFVHGPGMLHTRDPIAKLEDLKGYKFRAAGGGVKIAEGLGGVAVAVPAPESYETIQKGVADGAMFPFEAVFGFKLYELVHNHLQVPGGLYTTPFAVVMNKEKWDSLSDAHKAALTTAGGANGAKILGQGWDRADVKGKELALANGGTVTVLSDAETARWAKELAFMNDDWVKLANERGLDGPALLKDLKDTMAKFSAMN
jgi:TRAP-type C4-dicarboxylate transport system substrate-binding protein